MSRAGIVGGGVIGGGWAARFLLMGWDVAFHDPDPGAWDALHETLAQARRALPMLYDTALPAEGRLTRAASVAEAVAGADWVQESVPERLPLKHAVLAEIAAAAPEGTVVGSSTSGFTPTALREGLPEGAPVIVAHPFNPVYLLPLVEVVGAEGHVADRARAILTGIGMRPLLLRREIDGHIADRLLESVWREALWLIQDDIATTEEIDEAIRLGFGLRWAQMGLFETYRTAGGDAGMAHFIAQFAPALHWPWSRLTDVPDLDGPLAEKIAAQSDAQSGHLSIRALQARRDEALVAILRALRARDAGAGSVIAAHEATVADLPEDGVPLITVRRTVPIDWTDMNGHMNEGRYGQIFSDAAERVMALVGADADYVARGLSYFTVETTVKYLAETHAGEAVEVASRVTQGAGKKLRVVHEMRRQGETEPLATCDQLMIHVSLTTRRACDPPEDVEARVRALADAHR
ncbi:carnitine 3-dehydrogenase [Rhodobacteraceae bacterium CCMM004]|nr:carnitine 3-dehydrogenase [Rhodobacteraceae bacterium CCMM004]